MFQMDFNRLKFTIDTLLCHGKDVGYFLPWHQSKDSYHWAVAELLLRRTTRTAASKAFINLIGSYPTWNALADADIEALQGSIKWIGLSHQRSHMLVELASVLIACYSGSMPSRRDDLLKLPGIGAYTADAILLHVFAVPTFPIDPNYQRVIRRNLGLPIPSSTRSLNVYRDSVLRESADYIVNNYAVEDIQNVHRGVLHLAWIKCRHDPKCRFCPLQRDCVVGSGQPQ